MGGSRSLGNTPCVTKATVQPFHDLSRLQLFLKKETLLFIIATSNSKLDNLF